MSDFANYLTTAAEEKDVLAEVVLHYFGTSDPLVVGAVEEMLRQTTASVDLTNLELVAAFARSLEPNDLPTVDLASLVRGLPRTGVDVPMGTAQEDKVVEAFATALQDVPVDRRGSLVSDLIDRSTNELLAQLPAHELTRAGRDLAQFHLMSTLANANPVSDEFTAAAQHPLLTPIVAEVGIGRVEELRSRQPDVAGTQLALLALKTGDVARMLDLIDRGDPDVDFTLTLDPGTPKDVLRAYGQHPDELLRANVARRDDIPGELIEQLARDESRIVRAEIVLHPQLPELLRHQISSKAGVKEQLQMAEDPRQRPTALLWLAQSRNKSVRAAVAANPSAPSRVLDEVAKHLVLDPQQGMDDLDVLTAVCLSANQNSSDALRWRLAEIEDGATAELIAKAAADETFKAAMAMQDAPRRADSLAVGRPATAQAPAERRHPALAQLGATAEAVAAGKDGVAAGALTTRPEVTSWEALPSPLDAPFAAQVGSEGLDAVRIAGVPMQRVDDARTLLDVGRVIGARFDDLQPFASGEKVVTFADDTAAGGLQVVVWSKGRNGVFAPTWSTTPGGVPVDELDISLGEAARRVRIGGMQPGAVLSARARVTRDGATVPVRPDSLADVEGDEAAFRAATAAPSATVGRNVRGVRRTSWTPGL